MKKIAGTVLIVLSAASIGWALKSSGPEKDLIALEQQWEAIRSSAGTLRPWNASTPTNT